MVSDRVKMKYFQHSIILYSSTWVRECYLELEIKVPVCAWSEILGLRVFVSHNAFRGDKMNFDNLIALHPHCQVNKEKLKRKIFLPHSVSFYRTLPRVQS